MLKNKGFRYAVNMLCVLAFSVLMSMTALASSGKITFTDPSAEAGTEVNVRMKISLDAGALVSSANIMLQYPAEKLQFIEGTDASGGAGAIRVHGTSNGGGTSNVEYNLKFKALQAGSHSITIRNQEVYDAEEKAVTILHTGSSVVSVAARQNASTNCDLNNLEIYPGELTPAFSADVTAYEVTVGSSVDSLTVNALPADAASGIVISGNEKLRDGENEITILVTAADGNTTRQYTLKVNKTEGGPEGQTEESQEEENAEGVQLSSKGKTITIMNPGDDIVIPENFRSGIINIDKRKVKGWVNVNDGEPEYFIVYGMNDKGELNFYRYDMNENEMTIQRYFEDPIAASAVSGKEYEELQAKNAELQNTADFRYMLLGIVSVLAVVLLLVLIFLAIRLSAGSREIRQLREEKLTKARMSRDEEALPDHRVLQHNMSGSEFSGQSSSEMEETQVIRRPARSRRVSRKPVSEEKIIQDVKDIDDV